MANELQWNEWKMREIKKKAESYIWECNVFATLVSHSFFLRSIRKLLFRFNWDQWHHCSVAVAAAVLPIKFLFKNTLLFRRNLFLFFYMCTAIFFSLFFRIWVQCGIFTCQRKSTMDGKDFSDEDYIKSEGIDLGIHWL